MGPAMTQHYVLDALGWPQPVSWEDWLDQLRGPVEVLARHARGEVLVSTIFIGIAYQRFETMLEGPDGQRFWRAGTLPEAMALHGSLVAQLMMGMTG
jgi:hypothetical protein